MLRILYTSLMLALAFLAPTFSNADEGLPAKDRLKSCDERTALAAARELLNDPRLLKEPLEMFAPAFVLFQNGERDDGVFWFYAAQLRVQYQMAFERGDRSQLLSVMRMTIGAPINNYAFQNVANLDRILDRVMVWDKVTPNPYREKPKTDAIERRVESVYSGLNELRAKFASEKVDIEAKAREQAPMIEQMYSVKGNPHCRAGQVDPANVPKEVAKEKALVSQYIKNNLDIIRDAGEVKNTWVERGSTRISETMPYRYEVGVISTTGKESHAIVDVLRTDGDVKFSLFCIARMRWVSRDLLKDPCTQ
ncbi:hypothetical protein KGA65_11555 [Ideonella sp. B7]|uniref:hypothetical protein n=1 Tax=Ideonella benzenivorans TaxID=2831643 RepID=UPI001CEC00CE|nr:hypothetical protein [Ideonella benzenivorans]MCA6217178.1 hypothetical protein [Ideonella benzenivorans]